jgi:hypothetical protein
MKTQACVLSVLLALTGAGASLAPTQAQASDTCARISTFDIAPRKQDLHRAILIGVDGGMPGPLDSTSWRIEPGRHVLKLAEAIDAREFSPAQQRDRDGRRSNRYKTLEIDAEPGITYRVAAKFIRSKRLDIRGGGYWEPVIWKESAESCR